MSIDQKVVGGGGMWISKEIHINRGKIPLLNALKIRIFRLWHAARESVSKENGSSYNQHGKPYLVVRRQYQKYEFFPLGYSNYGLAMNGFS